MGKPLLELFMKQEKVLFRIYTYQSASDSNVDYSNPCAQFNSLCGVKDCFVFKMSD